MLLSGCNHCTTAALSSLLIEMSCRVRRAASGISKRPFVPLPHKSCILERLLSPQATAVNASSLQRQLTEAWYTSWGSLADVAAFGLAIEPRMHQQVLLCSSMRLASTLVVLASLMVTWCMQAPEHSPALREGSVLCLEDRRPLGRIEEILGPVLCPIYALRYAGDGGEMPAEVVSGAHVCSVNRFSHKLEEADLSAKV